MATDKTKDTEPVKPDVNAMSVEDRVRYLYSHGNSKGIAPSIQDIARNDRLSVDEVLAILGQNDLLSVQTQGDLIDSDEAGFNTTINHGELHKVNYSTN